MGKKQTITVETWTSFGLPAPDSEVRVCQDRLWRVDFLWDFQGAGALAVEVHGGTWSGGGHSRGVRQASDFAKGHRCVLNGWHRMEFTPKQVTSGYAPAIVRLWIDNKAPRPEEIPPDPEDRRKGSRKAPVRPCKAPSLRSTKTARAVETSAYHREILARCIHGAESDPKKLMVECLECGSFYDFYKQMRDST